MEYATDFPDHDFIAVVGTPGLGLPFCSLSSLSLTDATPGQLNFASDVTDYTAAVAHDVVDTSVEAVCWRSTPATPCPS